MADPPPTHTHRLLPTLIVVVPGHHEHALYYLLRDRAPMQVIGALADHIGRRRGSLLTSCIMLVGAILLLASYAGTRAK